MMNDQIKERLIKQAGFHSRPSIENTVPGIDWNCGSWGYDQCVDRLIEFVVQECIEQIQLSTARDPQTSIQYLQSVGHIHRIRQHFGIEK